jgi:uncharacterized protein
MRQWLQKLPFPVEFLVVVAGAFGYFAISGVIELIYPGVAGGSSGEFDVWQTVGIKTGILAAAGVFLWARGWTGARFGLLSDWLDGPWALALAAAVFVAMYAAAILVSSLVPGLLPHNAQAVQPYLTPYVVLALVLVSALFEELFAAGYVIGALKEKGWPNLGVNLSVAIRLVLHLSQGVIAVLVVVPMGLIFGMWYERTGKLWPLILAHTLFSAWSFAPYIKW